MTEFRTGSLISGRRLTPSPSDFSGPAVAPWGHATSPSWCRSPAILASHLRSTFALCRANTSCVQTSEQCSTRMFVAVGHRIHTSKRHRNYAASIFHRSGFAAKFLTGATNFGSTPAAHRRPARFRMRHNTANPPLRSRRFPLVASAHARVEANLRQPPPAAIQHDHPRPSSPRPASPITPRPGAH